MLPFKLTIPLFFYNKEIITLIVSSWVLVTWALLTCHLFVDFKMKKNFQRIILLNIVQFAVRIYWFSLAVSAELMMLFSLMVMKSTDWFKMKKSMWVTDVAGSVCCWQVWDIGDRFQHNVINRQSPTSQKSHLHSDHPTNIIKLSPW